MNIYLALKKGLLHYHVVFEVGPSVKFVLAIKDGPLAKTNVRAAATQPGSALTKAFDRKVQGAAAACQQQGLVFLPVAMETLGGMHKVAVEQMKRLGVAVARHQGSDERVATRQLFQRLSLTLMRGNAALVTSRRPDDDFAAPFIDGVI